jgi:PE family
MPRSILEEGKHMSFVTTQPGLLTSAAGALQGIGAAISSQNATAAGPTTEVTPAAADEVSALTAIHFAAHGALYQAIGAQAARIHEMLVTTLRDAAGSYLATEVANAAAMG